MSGVKRQMSRVNVALLVYVFLLVEAMIAPLISLSS
jgi:hypothetical protein